MCVSVVAAQTSESEPGEENIDYGKKGYIGIRNKLSNIPLHAIMKENCPDNHWVDIRIENGQVDIKKY